jgi:NAD(P)-dependent dehydrogenase (short-subunit alcohol dehydrogenase family)
MGEALGRLLTARGHDVVFSARASRARLEDVARRLAADGHGARVIDADLRDPSRCRALVAEAHAWRGRLDLLVCLASVYQRVPFDEITPEVWRDHLAVDLDASFHCAHAAAALMAGAGSGHIILSADWVAASGRPRYTGYVPYYVAKAGVVALAEGLALELAASGVRVNAIAPGPILPAAGTSAADHEAVLAATPLGRWGTPGALADAVGALLDASFVTGEALRVDGGRHLA